jgi:aconitate hydratase 2/2-methylisocitrate dehydratase
MLEAYRAHAAERASQNIPAKPLNADQVASLIDLLKAPPAGEEAFLLELISTRVPPGVDEAAYVKAGFLSAIVSGDASCPIIDKSLAIKLLGNMHGGYNIETLISQLSDDEFGGNFAGGFYFLLFFF